MSPLRGRGGIWLAACALLLAGCGGFYRPNLGPVGEKHKPVLEALWSQPEVGRGELWKIYLRASDPDGDLDKVFVAFGQYAASYPSQLLVLPASQRRRTNGAILVWARPPDDDLGGRIYGTVRARVEDRAGNMSEAKTLAFTFREYGKKDAGRPPREFAREVILGELDFPLHTDLRDN